MDTKSDQSDNKTDNNENKNKEPEGKKDSDSASIEDVKRIVNEAVESVKELFSSDDSSGSDDTTDKKDSGESEEKKAERRTRRTFSSIEADARRMVEDQVKSVLGELEHKKEHEELKKQPAQKAPIKVRRSTRFWLGKDYGND